MYPWNTDALFSAKAERERLGLLEGAAMTYFVNIRTNDLLLREGEEPIADLYEAFGRAALLASDLTDRYSKKPGPTMPSDTLAVEVTSDGGKVLFRVPVRGFCDK